MKNLFRDGKSVYSFNTKALTFFLNIIPAITDGDIIVF